MTTPRLLIVVFAVTFAMLQWTAHGRAQSPDQPLQLYSITSDMQRHTKGDSPVLRSASVTLSPALFTLPAKSEVHALLLPTLDGDVVGHVRWTRTSDADSFSLAGGLTDDAGHFVVTVHKGVATVSIHDAKGGWFRLEHKPEGYVMNALDLEALPECGACQAPELFQWSGTPDYQPSMAPVKTNGPAQIDVLVMYTHAARIQAGSAASLEALIVSAADMANLAYANSDIPLNLSVVHMEEVVYEEDASLAITLTRLTFPNDGYLDEVHALRDAHDADMVALITSGGDVAGIAWILDSLDGAIEQKAFSITVFYALGSLTFAHELGHNMGCDHDQQNITAEDYRLFSYSRGWRFHAAEDGVRYRTVMSYAPGARIPYFSNPDILYKGTATGVPIGHIDEAHCAQTISISAPHIALNRPRVNEGEEEGEGEGEPVIYEGYYCQLMNGIYTNEVLQSLLPAFAQPLFEMLNPAIADLNGEVDPETLTFLGNGMLDCAYELGLLEQVMEQPTLDLSSTGGVTHTLVAEALNANRAQLTTDIGSGNATIVDAIAPGLLDLAAAYITLGDEGSIGFVTGLMDIINEATYIGELNIGAYTLLPHYLSAEGDADGDGATNREEYEAYAIYGPDAYVHFALDPDVFPGSAEAGKVTITGRPFAVAGSSTTLSVVLSNMTGDTSIFWYKDDVMLAGEQNAEYHIYPVTADDAGVYRVVVTDLDKALYESAPFVLDVLPEGSLPVSGMLALALVAAALSCVGVQRTRRPR